MKVAYIDQHKNLFGVQPICDVLAGTDAPTTPSTYYAATGRPPSARSLRDEHLTEEIHRIHETNYGVYGARKVHAALLREGHEAARCTVERLMRQAGLRGVIRAKSPHTTRPAPETDRPADLVERRFTASAPDQLWVADITYIRTFSGWVYAAFVIDAVAVSSWAEYSRPAGRCAGRSRVLDTGSLLFRVLRTGATGRTGASGSGLLRTSGRHTGHAAVPRAVLRMLRAHPVRRRTRRPDAPLGSLDHHKARQIRDPVRRQQPVRVRHPVRVLRQLPSEQSTVHRADTGSALHRHHGEQLRRQLRSVQPALRPGSRQQLQDVRRRPQVFLREVSLLPLLPL
ncbi:IS3 family transposase [Streptomyces sp. NPDC096030]|uniref:IS3 family transposase n=1 Tax=Streptomyces sp. NPDC096030 TaxID=3155423 RepID=UPI0033259F83